MGMAEVTDEDEEGAGQSHERAAKKYLQDTRAAVASRRPFERRGLVDEVGFKRPSNSGGVVNIAPPTSQGTAHLTTLLTSECKARRC